MQGLMLIADSTELIPEFKQILVKAFPAATFSDIVDEDGFVLEFFGQLPNRIWIRAAGSDLEYIGWEAPEIEFITSYFPTNRHTYSIDYHSITTVKKAIVLLANSDHMLVDNDCGTLMPGRDFVRKVLAEPSWYWFDDLR